MNQVAPVCALPYFYSKRVKNGGIFVDVEKNLYLCHILLFSVLNED